LTNDKNERIAVQFDMSSLENHRNEIEDLLDVIIAESRKKDDEVESWETAKSNLKSIGNT